MNIYSHKTIRKSIKITHMYFKHLVSSSLRLSRYNRVSASYKKSKTEISFILCTEVLPPRCALERKSNKLNLPLHSWLPTGGLQEANEHWIMSTEEIVMFFSVTKREKKIFHMTYLNKFQNWCVLHIKQHIMMKVTSPRAEFCTNHKKSLCINAYIREIYSLKRCTELCLNECYGRIVSIR